MAENTGPSQPTAPTYVDITKFEKGRQLGKGGCGLVYLYKLKDGEEVSHGVTQMAVKELPTDEKKKDQVRKEIEIMCQLRHQNVVQYLGDHDVGDHLLIMLEYMPGGSVKDQLKRSGKFSEAKTRRYTRDILEGLRYLHDKTADKKEIIHRDIKGANVLLDRIDNSINGEARAKLADFGVSKILETNRSAHTFGGTFRFMSPEMIKTKPDEPGHGHGVKTDIWSTGCVVVQMLSSPREPWKARRDARMPDYQLMMLIAKCKHPEYNLPDGVSKEARDFINRCFVIEPKDRPSADNLLDDPFLAVKA